MSDFPSVGSYPESPVVICSHSSWEAIAYELICIAGASVTPVIGGVVNANRAYYIPFRVATPFLAAKMFVENGSPANGNVDVGIYTSFGVKLVSTGIVGVSGVNAVQVHDITDTLLLPGYYYFAFAASSTTAQFMRSSLTNPAASAVGVCIEDIGGLPLPATATLAKTTDTLVPVVGISRSVTV